MGLCNVQGVRLGRGNPCLSRTGWGLHERSAALVIPAVFRLHSVCLGKELEVEFNLSKQEKKNQTKTKHTTPFLGSSYEHSLIQRFLNIETFITNF